MGDTAARTTTPTSFILDHVHVPFLPVTPSPPTLPLPRTLRFPMYSTSPRGPHGPHMVVALLSKTKHDPKTIPKNTQGTPPSRKETAIALLSVNDMDPPQKTSGSAKHTVSCNSSFVFTPVFRRSYARGTPGSIHLAPRSGIGCKRRSSGRCCGTGPAGRWGWPGWY